jgi:glycosyltransferase involved in cell wall biosynthesis
MKIAVIAPIWLPVPPIGYGGTERVVALEVDELVARGHEVTLFASGDSGTRATVRSVFDRSPDMSLMGDIWYDAIHAAFAGVDTSEFDIVHDHNGPLGAAIAAASNRTPTAQTLHGPWTENAKRFYDLVDERVHLVAISERQRSLNPTARYAGVVHNGIDVATYEYRADKQDYLAYIGRAAPDKGPAEAIDLARRVDMPLKMIVRRTRLNAKPEEADEVDYWDAEIAPRLGEDIEVFEFVPHEVKVDLLANARAFVFPLNWEEPFGLTTIEAMACGTPVVARPMGALPEVVVDGETGFLCDTMDDLEAGLRTVLDGAIEPAKCRARVEQAFSAQSMADGYESIFAKLLEADRTA